MALVVFTLFFVAATANAIIISLLISLAVAGGFFALFFLCLTGIYIGALSVAAFVISTATISAIVSVLIASGWLYSALTLILFWNLEMKFPSCFLYVLKNEKRILALDQVGLGFSMLCGWEQEEAYAWRSNRFQWWDQSFLVTVSFVINTKTGR